MTGKVGAKLGPTGTPGRGTPLSAGRPGNEAPAGWRWFRLTDLARLETGHTPSRNHPEWWGGPIPWISLADIRELDGKVAQDTIEHTNEEGVCGPELDPHFLAFLLRASRAYIRSLSSGAIHQTVYMPTVESFFVSAPSIKRQREISESLSRQLAEAERARAVVEGQIGAINALPASLLRRAFGGGL